MNSAQVPLPALAAQNEDAKTPAPSSTLTSPLLALPAEIRRIIYGYISPLVNNYVSDYQGLFLACKQTYYEAQGQLIEQAKEPLEEIEADWAKYHHSPLRVRKPESFKEMKEVIIELPESFFRLPHEDPTNHIESVYPRFFHQSRDGKSESHPLNKLPLLRVHTLTLRRYEDEPERDSNVSRDEMWRHRYNQSAFNAQISWLLYEWSNEHCLKPSRLLADNLVILWDMGMQQGRLRHNLLRTYNRWKVEVHDDAHKALDGNASADLQAYWQRFGTRRIVYRARERV
jgi:hypothetical protein